MADSKPTGPVITDETRKLASLKDDPRNARRHSQAQIAQIIQSIEKFGYVNKVVIWPDGQTIGGHATREALARIGRTDVECRVVSGLTEAQYQALGLALNKIPENSSWQDDVLAEIMGELNDAGEDLTVTGFSSAERDKLLAVQQPVEVHEIETGPVDDEFWISIRGPLKHQAAALSALEAALKPYGDVTVDLGTISVG